MAERLQPVVNDEPNLDMAQRFLDQLNSNAESWTFQTTDDNKDRKDPKLQRILHGNLANVAGELIALNNKGAAVFASVNQTDGEGRRKENIAKVNAIPVDLDDPDESLWALALIEECPLKPQVIVETSPLKFQAIWRVDGLSKEQFEGVVRSIAERFGGDTAVAMLTCCARLPGFTHYKIENGKGSPFRSRIIEINEVPPYSADQILAEFPPLDKPHVPPKSRDGKLVLSPSAPLDSAKAFIDKICAQDGASAFHYYRGSFYAWDETHYRAADADHVRHQLYLFLDEAITENGPFNPNQNKVNQVMHALQGLTFLPSDRNPPFWIAPQFGFPGAGNVIACQNGLLDLEKRDLKPHDPRLFIVNCLPFEFDPEASKPRLWLKTLRQWWPDNDGDKNNKRARLALQEIFGLLLTNDVSHHTIFLIVGPTRSGKGVQAGVMNDLLGPDNVANPSFQSVSNHFGLESMIDKRAAIFTDARLSGRTDLSALTERLLKISGGDQLSIPRKYKTDWTGRLDVRFVIFSNELPAFKDASGVIAKRFFILEMENSFLGKEDRDLPKKLRAELPGILNWALRGLDRLLKRGRFKMPGSSEAIVQYLEALASPVAAFVSEWGETGPQFEVDGNYLYEAYMKWCEEAGLKPLHKIVFGRDLRSIVRGCRVRGRSPNKKYTNIALSESGADEYERILRSQMTHG